LAAVGTRAGVEGHPIRVLAPLLDQPKAGIVALGERFGVPWGETMSCYDPTPGGRHCGRCDSCVFRRRGFLEAGVLDPTSYAAAPKKRS
ncbi:MAG: 7-cyano-7-deazaguanine synthase, partial [Planctomycetota bacterium]